MGLGCRAGEQRAPSRPRRHCGRGRCGEAYDGRAAASACDGGPWPVIPRARTALVPHASRVLAPPPAAATTAAVGASAAIAAAAAAARAALARVAEPSPQPAASLVLDPAQRALTATAPTRATRAATIVARAVRPGPVVTAANAPPPTPARHRANPFLQVPL